MFLHSIYGFFLFLEKFARPTAAAIKNGGALVFALKMMR
jgi:hypothetical protein